MGNSRSVLYREVENDRFSIELSNDHVPSSKEERFRVYWNGGLVDRLVIEGHKVGPLWVWDKIVENGPGLEVTRCLGNTEAIKIGVSFEPEI